jgi:hypothetical protein
MENGSKLSVNDSNALIKELTSLVSRIYEIGRQLGFDNILEKAKLKEVIMGHHLGLRVFTKSTGEVKGADAINDQTGEVSEFKTTELKTKDVGRYFDAALYGTQDQTFAGAMTYNAAYDREHVVSYKTISHKHGVFYRGNLISITEVSPEYVIGDNGLMKRINKLEAGGVYKSTNGNSVSVHYENGGVRAGEGEVIFANDFRK